MRRVQPPPTFPAQPPRRRCRPQQNWLDANAAANEANTAWLPYGSTIDSGFIEDTFLEPLGTACAGWGINYPPSTFRRCLDPEQ